MEKNPPIISYIRGFTLVETLVAIAILTLAISWPLFLARNSISYSRLSQEQVTAVFLVQDVLEYVVAVKEYNINSTTLDNWLNNLDDCENGCIVDTTKDVFDPSAIVPCDGACEPLKLLNGFYRYSGTADDITRFVRTLYVQDVPNNTGERKVIVEVNFQSGIFNRSVNLKTNIYQISI